MILELISAAQAKRRASRTGVSHEGTGLLCPTRATTKKSPVAGFASPHNSGWTKTGARDGAVHGAPVYLRSDSGPEFVSNAILQWLTDARIETAIIDPGKPWQNGTNESFNGKFRYECLSVEWFRTRCEAQVLIEDWRQHFNAVRPHSTRIEYWTGTDWTTFDLVSRSVNGWILRQFNC